MISSSFTRVKVRDINNTSLSLSIYGVKVLRLSLSKLTRKTHNVMCASLGSCRARHLSFQRQKKMRLGHNMQPMSTLVNKLQPPISISPCFNFRGSILTCSVNHLKLTQQPNPLGKELLHSRPFFTPNSNCTKAHYLHSNPTSFLSSSFVSFI